MIRYILWQFGHMHALHFANNEQGDIYCPTCQSIYQQRKPMSTNRDDVTPNPSPKPERSALVLLTVVFLISGAAAIVIGSVFGLPWVGVSGLFNGLAAITLAVLSLREKQ